MNKLTPIFIAGAIVISAALAAAQSQMSKDGPMQGHDMQEMGMSDMHMPGMVMRPQQDTIEGRFSGAALG